MINIAKCAGFMFIYILFWLFKADSYKKNFFLSFFLIFLTIVALNFYYTFLFRLLAFFLAWMGKDFITPKIGQQPAQPGQQEFNKYNNGGGDRFWPNQGYLPQTNSSNYRSDNDNNNNNNNNFRINLDGKRLGNFDSEAKNRLREEERAYRRDMEFNSADPFPSMPRRWFGYGGGVGGKKPQRK